MQSWNLPASEKQHLKAPQIRAYTNASNSRHISSSTVQRRRLIKPSQSKSCKEKPQWGRPMRRRGKPRATTKWHQTSGNQKISALSYDSKFLICGSNQCVFVRHRKGERMVSTCVVPTMKHGGGGGVMVTLLVIYSTLKPHLTSITITAFCSDMPPRLVCLWDHRLFFNPQTHL